MQPFSAEWEKLSPLERIAQWLAQNKCRLKVHVQEYKMLLENFSITCQHPTINDYRNFQQDIRLYDAEQQIVLKEGFFAMYNTTQATLELHSIENTDPRMN